MKVLEADCVWPERGERVCIRDGVLVPEGSTPPSRRVSFRGDWIAITPGWIAAHVHLELRQARWDPEDPEFPGLLDPIEHRRTVSGDALRAAYERGADELLQSGAARAVDHCQLTDRIVDRARTHPLRIHLLHELASYRGTERDEENTAEAARSFLRVESEGPLPTGLAAEGPYSVSSDLYRTMSRLLDEKGGTWSSHLLAYRREPGYSGRATKRLRSILGDETAGFRTSDAVEGSFSYLARNGLFRSPGFGVPLLAGDERDARWVEATPLLPVICPRRVRSLAAFSGWLEDLGDGTVPFALGLEPTGLDRSYDLLNALEVLAEWDPDVPVDSMLRALTVHPSRVLGIPGRGVLTEGTPADLSVFDVPGGSLEHLVRGDARALAVFRDGACVWARPGRVDGLEDVPMRSTRSGNGTAT